MISGAFHALSQEWRYFSREKSIVHTLHLGQLPSGTSGDTIEIASTAPTTTNQGQSFSVPPLNIGNSGFGGGTFNVTIPTTTLSTCYGSVGPNRTILASKNMVIQYGAWDHNLKEILFTPQESGWFMIRGDATTGLLNSLYDNGTGTHSFATGDLLMGNSLILNGVIDRQPLGFTATSIGTFGKTWNTVQGGYAAVPPVVGPPQAPTPPNTPWNPNFYVSVIVSDGATYFFEGIKGLYFRIACTCVSNPPGVDFDMSAWVFKIANIK